MNVYNYQVFLLAIRFMFFSVFLNFKLCYIWTESVNWHPITCAYMYSASGFVWNAKTIWRSMFLTGLRTQYTDMIMKYTEKTDLVINTHIGRELK